MKQLSAVLVAYRLLTCESSWVDPDSPESAFTIEALSDGDNREYKLVFSDEFEQDGRTFHDGHDSRWTAVDKNDYTNAALHFYAEGNAQTTKGVLNITTERKDNVYKAYDEKKNQYYLDTKHVQSAMLQGWNKFCFIGGIIEFRAKLPGDPKVGGLWPALWMLGNLARATYVGSSDYIWPYSYNKCDERTRRSQEINACNEVNHYGLAPFQGRGSPEIDIIESMQGDNERLPNTFIRRPYQSASLQLAPGIEIDRPVLGHRPHKGHWYSHLEYGNSSRMQADLNPFFYGVTMMHELKTETYQSDAISANAQLNESNYKEQHLYRVEWEPPMTNGSGGYLKWYTDNEFVSAVYGDSLDIMETEIPSEPMYLIMNTAVSSSWGFPTPCPDGCECECFECGDPKCACALPAGYCDNFPAHFEIDYVRVYQAVNESRHFLGCSPEHRPTEQFIEGHYKRYLAEGQTRPLQPILVGGGSCSSDTDCGRHGICSSAGTCTCANEKWTGPHCRSHAAYYDVDTSAPIEPFSLSFMMIPKSLIIVVCLLLLGFLGSLMGTVRAKAKEAHYKRLSGAIPHGGTPSFPVNQATTGSYQHQGSDHYALPPKQKEVTYCVIDGRLVDS